jgi:hypothetical protein
MFPPTAEQQSILDARAMRRPVVVQALAGTGKTSTIKKLAAADGRPAVYTSFSKAIVADVKAELPTHVAGSTAHSLAFRAVGRPFGARLNGVRPRWAEVAKILRLRPIYCQLDDGRTKVLQPTYLAGRVMAGLRAFCQSPDLTPSVEHFPYVKGIDAPVDGKRGWANNRQVRTALYPALLKAWEDVRRPDGALPYAHDHYLKYWQVGGPTGTPPRIPAAVIYLDEAQDLNPVLADIVRQQQARYGAELVVVGDSNQAIYGFTGARDALGSFGIDTVLPLTQSWRFGSEIADTANEVLELLPTDLRLVGNPHMSSTVGPLDTPDVVLFRSNAASVGAFLGYLALNLRPHIVGGAKNIHNFAQAKLDLDRAGYTSHPELTLFSSWEEVQRYVTDEDSDGEDAAMAVLVQLVDDHGAERLVSALAGQAKPEDADVILSTAHKAKGLQWPTVQIGPDFPTAERLAESADDDNNGGGNAELRLIYVAATRARETLDVSGVDLFREDIGGGRSYFSEHSPASQ